jgi:hypothetical protein
MEEHEVHGRTIRVVIEEPRTGSAHASAPDDVCNVLRRLPAGDVSGLDLVVLRQPTRKEDVLSPAWGRIHWCVEFHGYTGPAITLDAVDFDRPHLRWPRSLSPEDERDLRRLRRAGFSIAETKRGYDILLTREHVRRWLLTQTVPHEVGHWVDYRKRVLDPLGAVTAWDAHHHDSYNDLAERWRQRPERECEQYANRYADEVQNIIEGILDSSD